MTDAVRKLTRQQLVRFLLGDHQAVRTFERMQENALETTPAAMVDVNAAIEDLSQLGATTDARLSEVIAASNRLSEAIEGLLTVLPPVPVSVPDDFSPPVRQPGAEFEDLFPRGQSTLPDDLSPPPLPLTGGMLATIIGGALAANPTATVGPTATNGTATTYMRSDAAPAINLTATYTWTGPHTFTAAGGAVVLANTAGPILRLSDTDAAANQKNVRVVYNSSLFQILSEDDAFASATSLLTGIRSAAAWTSVIFGNTTDNPTYGFVSTATATFSGQVTALRFVPTSSTVATNGMYLPAANTVGLSANSTLSAQLTSTTFQALLQLILSGDITPAQLTANQDDWNPTGLSTATVIRASTDASRNLTGIQGGADGRVLILINVGTQPLVLVHDLTSTAANRFLLASGTNTTIQAGGACILWYDSTSSRWRQITRVA